MSEDLMLERLRRMDHKLDGFIEDMRGIRLDVQEIKTRIALNRAGDPRLCRGGSNSLTFPEVHRDHRFCEPPSTRKVKSRWTSLRV